MARNQLNPWNWFKHEEKHTSPALTQRNASHRHPMWQIHQEIDRLIDNAFHGINTLPFSAHHPLADITQHIQLKPHIDIASNAQTYTITVEVPGVEEDNIKLELVDHTLTITGEKKQSSENKDNKVFRTERTYGMFQRVLSLPEDAVTDAIQARFKNGVLTLSLPRKTTTTAKSRVIEIEKVTK